MTHVTCRLTAKNRDQLRNPTLRTRVWATFTFYGMEQGFTSHSTQNRSLRRRSSQPISWLVYFQRYDRAARQTHRHGHHNTPLAYRGRSKHNAVLQNTEEEPPNRNSRRRRLHPSVVTAAPLRIVKTLRRPSTVGLQSPYAATWRI